MAYYAHVSAGTIDALGQPPEVAFAGGRWWDLRPRDAATLASAGWFQVVEVARPADTATHTHDRSVQLVNSVPTEVWTQRPKTQAEIDGATAAANEATLRTNPQTHIDLLLGSITALQAVRDTANATINASPASFIKDVAQQGQVIARRAVRLARLQLGVLDSTNTGE